MANRIRLRRGLKNELPDLSVGEMGYCTDTNEIYIGSDKGNICVNGRNMVLVSSTEEMDEALSNAKDGDIIGVTTLGSTKISVSLSLLAFTRGSLAFVGVGRAADIVLSSGWKTAASYMESNPNELIFKDLNVEVDEMPEEDNVNVDFIFENCNLTNGENSSGNNGTMLNCKNARIDNCRIRLTDGTYGECYSGFRCSGHIIIASSQIYMSLANFADIELNLIYNAGSGVISDSYIVTDRPNAGTGKVNIVNNGNVNMTGNTIVLKDANCSICHYNTVTTPTASFVGNNIDFYGSYMRFAVINGNTFNHIADSTTSENHITLLSPTVMSGNLIKGAILTVDAQNKKVIICTNISDNVLTVASAASGSVTTNNITY